MRMSRFDEAGYHLHEYERIDLPEHAWIQRLHQRVFSEFSHQDHLVLREEQLTKKEAYLELKKFLIAKAEAKAKRERGKVTAESVAEIIEISRETLQNWRSEIAGHTHQPKP